MFEEPKSIQALSQTDEVIRETFEWDTWLTGYITVEFEIYRIGPLAKLDGYWTRKRNQCVYFQPSSNQFKGWSDTGGSFIKSKRVAAQGGSLFMVQKINKHPLYPTRYRAANEGTKDRLHWMDWVMVHFPKKTEHIFPRRTRKKFRNKSSQPSVRSSRNLPRESTSAASGAARRFQERKTTGKKVLIKIFDWRIKAKELIERFLSKDFFYLSVFSSFGRLMIYLFLSSELKVH